MLRNWLISISQIRAAETSTKVLRDRFQQLTAISFDTRFMKRPIVPVVEASFVGTMSEAGRQWRLFQN